MERKCKRREAMTAVINIKRQQRDQKHLWVWGSRMALGRGVSGSGLCSEVSAIGEDQLWGDKREYAQTRQGQVRAFLPFVSSCTFQTQEMGRGMERSPCNTMEMLSTPHWHHSFGPQALPKAWPWVMFGGNRLFYFPLHPFSLQPGALKTDLWAWVCFKLITSELPWLLNLTTGPMTLVSLQHPGAFQSL